MAYLNPSPKVQFFDSNGDPLVGGKLYTYAAGTTTPLATYIDQAQSGTNTNPVILDSRGEANVWLGTTGLYKFVLTTSTDSAVWTVDNIGYQYLSPNDLYNQGTEVDVASASTVNIGAENTCFLRVTGTTTITSFGTTYKGPRYIRFAAALTLTHNASTLILPTGANITTAAGDYALVVPKATSGTADGWAVAVYQKANGQALVSATDYLNTTRIDVASAATVDLTTNAPSTRNINITGTTTITAFTVAIGQLYFVRFNAALTLTNNASIVTQTGANITTAAGDTCILRATAANTVEVLSYVSSSGVAGSTFSTSAQVIAGTSTATVMSPSAYRAGAIVNGGAVTTVSGTSKEWLTVPSWAKRIHMQFVAVSIDAATNFLIQIGNGSYTSGYESVTSVPGVANTNSTAGFIIAGSAAVRLHGFVTLEKFAASSFWICSYSMADYSGAFASVLGGGYVDVGGGGSIDRVKLTTVSGTANFDAGNLNITWE